MFKQVLLAACVAVLTAGCSTINEIIDRVAAKSAPGTAPSTATAPLRAATAAAPAPAPTTAPYVWVATFEYTKDLSLCLNNAENTLTKHGFVDNRSRDHQGNDQFGRVYGDKPDEKISAVILCDMSGKFAITSVAVSGLDKDSSWKAYEQLFEAQW
jgi:hypothetical protein